jgi:hypothetical protein
VDVFEEVIMPVIRPVEVLVDGVIAVIRGAQESTQADFALCSDNH